MTTAISPSEPARLLKLATYASVATAGTLIVAKLVAWLMSDSVSILASLIDSVMDAAASLVNLFAVHYSLMPADKEHRFGHGKAESLAGLAQATFIAGSALVLFLHAIDRLRYPRPVDAIETSVGVMVFAIVVTLLLLMFQRYVIKKTASTAIRADSLHYATDLLTNVSVIIALGLAAFGWQSADAMFAIGIAAYIVYSAWQIGFEAFHQLMDRELPDELRRQIKTTVLSNPRVRGLHDLRTRQSGQTPIIQLHLELDDDMPLIEAHAIADEAEAAILVLLPGADVVIHQDPVSSTVNPANN